jgi:hypothetical protein
MRLDVFLRQFVDGYLLHDLDSLSRVVPTGAYGAAGYPMLAAAMAGIELLGGLVCNAPFRKNDGHLYFERYWDVYLAPINPCYVRGMSGCVRNLVRHGIAHTYTAKPGIKIVKTGRPPALSYDQVEQVVVVDCLALCADFKASYAMYPVKSADTAAMQGMLDGMLKQYAADEQSWLAPLATQLPSTSGTGITIMVASSAPR